MTTTHNPFAAFGDTEEIDTRTADIPTPVVEAMDAAVAHFSTRQNKKQLRVTKPDAESAVLFASQLRGYAAANGIHISTLEQVGCVVTFRFAKVRQVGDPDDGTYDEPADVSDQPVRVDVA